MSRNKVSSYLGFVLLVGGVGFFFWHAAKVSYYGLKSIYECPAGERTTIAEYDSGKGTTRYSVNLRTKDGSKLEGTYYEARTFLGIAWSGYQSGPLREELGFVKGDGMGYVLIISPKQDVIATIDRLW